MPVTIATYMQVRDSVGYVGDKVKFWISFKVMPQ